MKRAILAALLALATAAPARADVDDGVAALRRGDYGTARAELTPLAERGNARAQYLLGRMYARGAGVGRDVAEARRWYRRAAVQGVAAAQLELGMALELGRGGRHDADAALTWIVKAAEQAYAVAQFYLGAKYEEGAIVEKDFVRAHLWYTLAKRGGGTLLSGAAVSALADLEARMSALEMRAAAELLAERSAPAPDPSTAQ